MQEYEYMYSTVQVLMNMEFSPACMYKNQWIHDELITKIVECTALK